MTDYSKSKYQNATAERAYAIVLDGFAEDSIYDIDGSVVFDLVSTEEDGRVILRYDAQEFVDVETSYRDHANNGMTADTHGHFGRSRVLCYWKTLQAEYEPEEAEA